MNNLSFVTTLLLIVPMVIASWVLIHLLALLGVFLGFAYPMWWLFAPRQTVCFICRATPDGGRCPLCHKHVNRSAGIYPKSLFSGIMNGLLIVVFSLVSIGLVYGESRILYKLGFPQTPKTASFVIPSKGQYRIGEVFPMKIEISNLKNAINTVQADLGFDPSKLEAQEISTKDSFATLFVQKDLNNSGGWARLTGGLPNPGYSEAQGTFGTIYFKGKAPGIVKVQFLTTSMVLANDGRGTNILKDYPAVTFLILPERISADEEKTQESVMKKEVLGASTGGGQLTFYDGKDVLGASTAVKDTPSAQKSVLSLFLDVLEKVDRFVLESWGKLFGVFAKQ